MHSEELRNKYKKKIQAIAEELAQEIIDQEEDLESKYRFLDADVQEILINVGTEVMRVVGESVQENVKKKPPRKA